MPTLAELYKQNTTAKGTTMSSLSSPVEEKKDFGEGLAYLGEKAAVGFVSSVEGIWDFAASGIAKLFGADDWAEEQIANDWFGDWYSHPDEWFQPTGGWKLAGDVASGIGTSLPAMAAVGIGAGIAAVSGGTLAPAAIGLISAGVAGLGAADRGVKEAYEQTGNLSGKEYLYGAGTGIVEGGIEGVMNAIGLGGVGSVFKNFGKSATKSMASRVGVAVVDGFLGEAFEEGFSELVTPYIKRFTYDPNAKNATLAEIGYAALVGGLSGALMGGGGAAVDVSSSLISGTKAINNGRTAEITEYGKIASAFEDTQKTKDEYYERVASSYKALSESLEKTGGEIRTANQRMMLGDLAKSEVRATVAPMLYNEAANILNDVEGFVARFNGNEYTDLNGKPITLTAEQLTKGFDRSNPTSIREAIKTNDTLRTVSAMAAAGKLMSNTSAMADNVLKGQKLKSEVDLAQFAERASTEEIEALSRELEIDDWSSLSLEDFNDRLEAYRERGGVEKYAERQKLVNKMKKIKQGKSVPKGVAGLKNGQVTRYSDGTLDVGVANVGGSYLLYDFNSGNESRLLTHEEINTYFREYSQEQYKAEQTKREQDNAKRKAEVEELDTWARENITDYATLAASTKTMIRKVIRQARANGLSESDVKMWADMSAHSGIDVIFDKRLSEIKVKVEQEDGTVKTETRFANAYYDEKGNRIVVNPEARISQEKALFHELDHALRSFFGGGTPAIYKGALDSLDDTTKAKLKEQYGSNEAIFNDEANAFYAAEVMGEKGFARSIATTKPKAFEKIMNFFKDAINYKNDGYSKAARKYYKQYKEMYEAFSAVNKGSNALEGAEGGKRYSTLPEGARAALNINSSRSKAQRLAKAAQGSYNKRRDPLINRTFPPYNESASEANERATRWAHKEDVKAGDERIAFYHNRMYLIQKTDDLHGERYIILRRVLVKEYNLIKQELEKGNTYGRIMSIEEEINKSNISNTSSNANRRRGSSVDSDEFTEEGRIYREVSRLGSLKTDGIERTEHNGAENSQRSSEDRQRREAVRLETDSNGKTLSEGQQEFFKDSKVRDEDGNLLVVYHGSPNKFTTFRQGVAEGWGKGIYFTDNRDEAINFGDNIVVAYLNITNPFDADTMNYDKIGAESTKAYRDFDMKKWQKWYSFEYDTYEEYQEDGMGVDMYEIYTEEKEVFNKILRELGYDGIIATGSNSIDGLEIVAFNESQPKLTTNKNPTSDTDIRYSLDIDSIMEQTRGKVHAEPADAQKPKLKESISTAWTGLQISLTNEQAGIEKIGKKFGIKDIDVTVQMARAAMNEAQEMIGGNQYRIGAEGKKQKQGEGLAKIFEPIDKLGKEEQQSFDEYLLHWHNTSRMSLKEKSEAKINEAQTKYDAEVKKLESSMRKIQKLTKAKETEGADVKAIKKQLATERKNAASLRKSANALKKELNSLTVEENKPIFMVDDNGTERAVTAEESKAIIAKIDKEHPEYKAIAEKVWAYSRNLNQYRVDTGLISQEEFDYLNEKYPYYVPTYREGKNKGISAITGDSNLAIKLTVKTAKGSGLDVMAIKTIMARQTVEAIRAGRLNQMAKAVYDTIGKGNDYVVEVKREKNDDLEVNPVDERPKNNQITFFENGEKVTLAVTKEIFAGFEGFHTAEIADNILYQWTNAVNSGFKKLVTGWSPAFMIRNPIKDVQDAGLYTKYGKTFAKNYGKAIEQIKNDGELWQLYRAMGGLSASLFNYYKGTQGSQNKYGFTKAEGRLLKKGVNAVENANMFVEQLPRLAEFISAIEAGVSPEQAILDAADITTNFGRTGKITKILNSTIIPFLNPSIQGFSKMIRTVTSIKTAREAGALFIKATLLGIAPMVLNMLMYGDDDEYKDLRENDKENNFLFKIGDTFIKIPRGRVASAIGGLVNRGVKTVKGEDADWGGYLENVQQQVTPVDSMTRTIFSPFYDVATNTTWYGTEIEGRQFENVAPSERYDESTSEIAKVMAKVINILPFAEASPKKIHYLLDQYSGVVGDFLLPATSKKAEKDFFSGNFTIDPATSNKISSDFYKVYDKAQYAKSSGDEVAKYQVRYLNKVKSTVSDLYKEKSAIQNSDLKGVEKLQQTRAIQILINQTFKTAMADYEAYTKAFETTSAIENEDYRYIESVRMVRGAESALKEYNEKVYEKYSLVAKSGISYDDLYYYYFVHKDLEGDKDKQGNTIAGSKSKKAASLVNSLKISKNQKLLLLAASGYSVGDKATKVSLARYITSLNATKDEKAALAELCGYKVKNGTILLSAIK